MAGEFALTGGMCMWIYIVRNEKVVENFEKKLSFVRRKKVYKWTTQVLAEK